MASKISGLDAVVTPADTDEFAVNQGGVSRRMTRSQIRTGLASASDIVNVDQNDIAARLTAGSGLPAGVAPGDLTEEETPATGDFLLGWESGGGLRKFDIGDLPSTAGTQLSDLSDVGDTTATNLNLLVADGASWEARALGTTDIQSGVFADARIAQSNVTQHVAAINHDALLNFVANEHIDHTSVSISPGTGLTGGGTIAATRTLSLDDTAVTPASYTLASITVDQQGRITAASNGSGVDATGTLVPTVSGVLAVTAADHGLHKNVLLTSNQASSVFTIAKATGAGTMFAFAVQHDTCTIVIEDNAGSINSVSSATSRLTNGGFVVARVMSNAGSAPVIAAIGNLVVAPATVSSTKTYDLDDHGGTYVLDGSSGTQTFSTAVASMFAGYEVMIVNDSGASRTIAGLDASHTLLDNGFVTVTKMGASLLAVGSNGVTVLDAA